MKAPALLIVLIFTCVQAIGQNYYLNAVECKGNIFYGRERAYAKTHRSEGPTYVAETINDLLESELILPDIDMRKMNISLHEESRRTVPEEDRDVELDTAYIYGIYREPNNDYHIILGNGEMTLKKMRLISAIVSALPGDDIDPDLERVRKQIVERFGDIPCGSDKWKPVEYPIPVKITGSLFFDLSHLPGIAGFGEFRPKTSWQIRPVTHLEFVKEVEEGEEEEE
jgi:hypothetical protein